MFSYWVECLCLVGGEAWDISASHFTVFSRGEGEALYISACVSLFFLRGGCRISQMGVLTVFTFGRGWGRGKPFDISACVFTIFTVFTLDEGEAWDISASVFTVFTVFTRGEGESW